MKYPLRISHNGGSWPARQIKRADLSTGYLVYLFERVVSPAVKEPMPFVVAVKSPVGTTPEWMTFKDCSRACQYYLNMICCYA